MERIEFTYEGETIRYDEDGMGWRWNGSDRLYAEPKNVRDAIDRAQGKGKNGTPNFERRKAIHWSYRGIQEVDVTSKGDGWTYWISSPKDGRGKIEHQYLYALTEENKAKIEAYREKEKEIKAIEAQRAEIRASMLGFHEWLTEQEKEKQNGVG